MSSYCETLVFLPVQRLLAPDHSRLIINLKQVLRFLVHTRPFQLVDHLTCKDFVRFDLDRNDCYNFAEKSGESRKTCVVIPDVSVLTRTWRQKKSSDPERPEQK